MAIRAPDGANKGDADFLQEEERDEKWCDCYGNDVG